MTYELALISVLIGAGYWGVFYVRRRPHGSATFGLMRLAMLSRALERGASGIAPDDYHVALDGMDDVFARSRHELNIHLRKICENHAELAE